MSLFTLSCRCRFAGKFQTSFQNIFDIKSNRAELIKSRINCLSSFYRVHLTPKGHKFPQNIIFLESFMLRVVSFSRSMFIHNNRKVCVCVILISQTIINSAIHNINFYELHNGLSGPTKTSQRSLFSQHFTRLSTREFSLCSKLWQLFKSL